MKAGPSWDYSGSDPPPRPTLPPESSRSGGRILNDWYGASNSESRRARLGQKHSSANDGSRPNSVRLGGQTSEHSLKRCCGRCSAKGSASGPNRRPYWSCRVQTELHYAIETAPSTMVTSLERRIKGVCVRQFRDVVTASRVVLCPVALLQRSRRV